MRGYPSDNQTRLGQQKHLAGTGGHPNSGKTLGSVVRLAAWLCLSMTLSGVFTLAETAYSPIPRDPSSGLIKQQAPWFQIMARALQTQEPTRGMLENSIERTLAEIELPNNTLSNHIVNDPLVPYDQFPVGPLDEIHQTYHTIEDVVEHELGLDETIKPEYSRVQIVLPQHGVIQESENSWGETEESAGSSHNWANEDAVSLNKRFQMDLFQQVRIIVHCVVNDTLAHLSMSQFAFKVVRSLSNQQRRGL